MNRLARIIEEMPLVDLKLLQKDLEAGNLDRLIRRRLETLEQRKTCPTCGSELLPEDQKFALEFGPRGLRQKAYFDEYDCMQYFLEKLEAEGKRQSGTSVSSSPSTSGDEE